LFHAYIISLIVLEITYTIDSAHDDMLGTISLGKIKKSFSKRDSSEFRVEPADKDVIFL
jgi:hypothetical protein